MRDAILGNYPHQSTTPGAHQHISNLRYDVSMAPSFKWNSGDYSLNEETHSLGAPITRFELTSVSGGISQTVSSTGGGTDLRARVPTSSGNYDNSTTITLVQGYYDTEDIEIEDIIANNVNCIYKVQLVLNFTAGTLIFRFVTNSTATPISPSGSSITGIISKIFGNYKSRAWTEITGVVYFT